MITLLRKISVLQVAPLPQEDAPRQKYYILHEDFTPQSLYFLYTSLFMTDLNEIYDLELGERKKNQH